jgi:hypothetical protein
MSKKTKIDEIYKLLGENTALIPIKEGTKKVSLKTWKDLTLEQTLEVQFQEKLCKASNIGVLQGSRSNNLCSIDLDDDELVEEFLIHNPRFKETLITKGSRGANLWFRALGLCPRVKLEGWGEIRGEGAYTLIRGIHPSGIEYSFINENQPLSIAFEKIKLPPFGVKNSPPNLYVSESVSESVTTSISYNYITSNDSSPLSRIKALNESEKRFEEWKTTTAPHIIKNYETYIERDSDMDFSIRNHELIRHTTVLYTMVGTDMAEQLVRAFYRINKPFFQADIHQHMKEFSSHYEALQKSYLGGLPKEELEFYQVLPPLLQDTFRICRDLASFEDENYSPPLFHLSYQELANRIGIRCQEAQRLMKKLQYAGFVSMKKKGQRYKPGRRSKASVWKWNCSLPIKQEAF